MRAADHFATKGSGPSEKCIAVFKRTQNWWLGFYLKKRMHRWCFVCLKKATLLSSLLFLCGCDLNSGGFRFSAFEIMFPSLLCFAFLPSRHTVCVRVCVTRLVNSGSNTDVLIEIQRLAARLWGTHTHIHTQFDSRDTFTLGDRRRTLCCLAFTHRKHTCTHIHIQ